MTIVPQRPAEGNSNAWAELPREILNRLAAEGVRDPAAWRALSRARRRSIFGITPSMAKAVDAAAGKEP